MRLVSDEVLRGLSLEWAAVFAERLSVILNEMDYMSAPLESREAIEYEADLLALEELCLLSPEEGAHQREMVAHFIGVAPAAALGSYVAAAGVII